jgi:hypothetical protein
VILIALLVVTGCARNEAGGSPEAVADSFAAAYFVRADQQRAKQYTAFGATKMLDQEIAETKSLRDSGYTPSEAALDVNVTRGARSSRGERVRFDYLVRFSGGGTKHADVELARVSGEWKVVRVAVANAAAGN